MIFYLTLIILYFSMHKEKFAALVGPTGVGKTEISILLAGEIPLEIISLDSRQIYQHLNIGVAKPPKNVLRKIKHHLIDEVSLNDDWTVADFKRNAEKVISELNKKNILPLLVGGTGLYLRAIIENLTLGEVKGDKNIRQELEGRADKFGNEYIYQKLKEIDHRATLKIAPGDRKRIIRALEVFWTTGKKFSESPAQDKAGRYNYVLFGITCERQKLYQNINQRVDKMVDDGLFFEVKNILSLGYSERLNSLQTIGYREIIKCFKNEMTRDEAIDIIKKETRNYAKRQLTFFRGIKDIIWLDLDDKNKEEIVKEIKLIISKKLHYS